MKLYYLCRKSAGTTSKSDGKYLTPTSFSSWTSMIKDDIWNPKHVFWLRWIQDSDDRISAFLSNYKTPHLCNILLAIPKLTFICAERKMVFRRSSQNLFIVKNPSQLQRCRDSQLASPLHTHYLVAWCEGHRERNTPHDGLRGLSNNGLPHACWTKAIATQMSYGYRRLQLGHATSRHRAHSPRSLLLCTILMQVIVTRISFAWLELTTSLRRRMPFADPRPRAVCWVTLWGSKYKQQPQAFVVPENIRGTNNLRSIWLLAFLETGEDAVSWTQPRWSQIIGELMILPTRYRRQSSNNRF